MTEIIKKIAYTSIGAASVTNEKFKELVEDLIQNNHFTEEEGKRIIDNFFYDLRLQVDTLNGSVKMKMDELLKRYGIYSILSYKNEVEDFLNEMRINPSILLKLTTKK